MLSLHWYLIPIFIFTFILTFSENLWIFLISFFVLTIFYAILSFKNKNISFLTMIFLLGSLSLFSYFLFNLNFYKTNNYSKSFVKKTFVVTDTYKLGQYVLTDDFWWTFIWKKMAKWYKIWDKLKIYWTLVPVSWNFDLWYKSFTSFNFNIDIAKLWTFDYDKFLKMKWINGIIYSKAEYVIGSWKTDVFSKTKQQVSDNIKKLYDKYPDKYKALVLWLLIWDKSLLDPNIYKEFINSGLVHIIVVSGGNMMFFMIFLSFLLFFIPFYIRLIFIWAFIIVYAMVVWWDSSVIRALIMWVLWLLALFVWRSSSTKRLLWIAFLVMLIYNPYFLVYDLGFILSFLAVLWILYFSKFQIGKNKTNDLSSILQNKITSKNLSNTGSKFLQIKNFLFLTITKFWNEYVLATVWASIFTAPAILFFTKQMNILWFLASLIVVPFVPIIMLVNVIALIILYLNLPGYDLLVWLNKPLLDLVFYVSNLFGSKITLFLNI